MKVVERGLLVGSSGEQQELEDLYNNTGPVGDLLIR